MLLLELVYLLVMVRKEEKVDKTYLTVQSNSSGGLRNYGGDHSGVTVGPPQGPLGHA